MAQKFFLVLESNLRFTQSIQDTAEYGVHIGVHQYKSMGSLTPQQIHVVISSSNRLNVWEKLVVEVMLVQRALELDGVDDEVSDSRLAQCIT